MKSGHRWEGQLRKGKEEWAQMGGKIKGKDEEWGKTGG